MVSNKRISHAFKTYGIIIFGLLLLLSGIVLKEHRQRVLSFQGRVGEVQEVSNPPVRIEIPSAGVNLFVEPGSITDGVWSISEVGASHLIASKSPGEGGNVVIYAHNKNNLFGPIRSLNSGDEIVVSTNNNDETHKYEVSETHTVTPDAIEYVLPKDEETLTLYTCTGFADSKRFIVVAKLSSDLID